MYENEIHICFKNQIIGGYYTYYKKVFITRYMQNYVDHNLNFQGSNAQVNFIFIASLSCMLSSPRFLKLELHKYRYTIITNRMHF